MKKTESYLLKLTQAVVIDGAIVTAGRLVEVTAAEAQNLMARGKAELATEDGDKAQEDAEADAAKAEAEAKDKPADEPAPAPAPAPRKGKAA